MKEALTKKLGPLPRWAWAVIALAGLFLYLRYRSNQAANATAAQNSQDPYAAYNNAIGGSGYQESDSGVIPAGGGLGSGFDPTSFEEGLQYAQGFGTSSSGGTTTGTNGDNTGNQGNGTVIPTPIGAQPFTGPFDPNGPIGSLFVPPSTENTGGGRSVSRGGKKGVTGAKTPTKKTGTGHHPATTRHTSTGGGPPTRKTTTHTKTPSSGTHRTTSAGKLASGGVAKAGATVVKLGPVLAPHPKRKARR